MVKTDMTKTASAAPPEKPLKTVTEGRTKLFVPDVKRPEQGEAFYNPVMRISRDISICAYAGAGGRTFLDTLAACGARGLRAARELKMKVTLCDRNPAAIKIIEKNAKANKLKVEIVEGDANCLLAKRFFDIVDVDPFGSPVDYLDLASKSAKKMLSITATDTAPLCGVYPEVCFRRYMAEVSKTEYFHEVGVRILAGYGIRCAAKYDVALKPVLMHSTNHYYRVYFEKSRGAGRAQEILNQVNYLHHCEKCLYRETGDSSKRKCKRCGGEMVRTGPIYTGPIASRPFCKKALNKAKKSGFEEAADILKLLSEECDLPAWHYDMHSLSSILKVHPVKLSSLLEKLKSKRFSASRTHFSPMGFRTDAPLEEILETYASLHS